MEFSFFIIIFRCFIQPQTVTANVEDFGIGLQLTEKDGLFVVDYLSPYSPFNFLLGMHGFQIRLKCVTPRDEGGIGAFLAEMSVTYFMDSPLVQPGILIPPRL